MKEIGSIILKVASMLAILVGIVAVFLGFFFLQESALSTDYSLQTRLQNVANFYIMCFGIADCVFGFYGTMNAEEDEANKRCLIYGIVMIVMCIINVVLMSIVGNLFAVLSLIITMVPLAIALAYILGTVLKIKGKPMD